MPMWSRAFAAGIGLPAVLALSACTGPAGLSPSGASPIASARPAGQASAVIPRGVALVQYTNPLGHYSFAHPEGWAQTGSGPAVRFTAQRDGVVVVSIPATAAPTVSRARTVLVPALAGGDRGFELRSVEPVTVGGARGVRIVFRREESGGAGESRTEVEEYDVYAHGRLIRMDLYGPVGADNSAAYRRMVSSLRVS